MVGDVNVILDHSSTFPYTPTTMETPTQPSSTTYVRFPAQIAEGIHGDRCEDPSVAIKNRCEAIGYLVEKVFPGDLAQADRYYDEHMAKLRNKGA